MRYILVFIGGLVAGILLFLLMQKMASTQMPVPNFPDPKVRIYTPKIETPPQPPVVDEPQKAPQPPQSEPRPPRTTIPVEPTDLNTESDSETTLVTPGEQVKVDFSMPEPGTYAPGGQVVCSLMIAPQYPRAEARAGTEGAVELMFTVQPDGSVTDIDIISATPRGVFDQAAKRAVAKWRCSPDRVNGQPVAKRVRQVIQFQLDETE